MQWILGFSIGLLVVTAIAATPTYKVDHRISLPGAEGWDCLSIDPSTNHLFVTRGSSVQVVDLSTEKLVGTIATGIEGAHDVVFDVNRHQGFISSGKRDKVVVFDLNNLSILKEIPTGKKPDILLFHSGSGRVFSFNGSDHSATVIDANTGRVLKTISLPGKPEFAVEKDAKIFVNDEDKNEIHVIDAEKMTLEKTWNYKTCQSPSGLAIDAKNNKLFAACENEVMEIFDAKTGKSLQTVPIGKGPDGAGFDSDLAFSSNGSGSLTIINQSAPNKWGVQQELATQKGARTMVIDPKTHKIYSITAQFEPSKEGQRPKAKPGTVELLVISPQ